VTGAERCTELLELFAADHTRLSVLDQDLRRRLVTAATPTSNTTKFKATSG
jgi:hypothetical protein